MDTLLARIGETEITAEQLAVIMLFLESLIRETPSKDVLHLAAARAHTRAAEMGIDGDTIAPILNRLVAYTERCQAAHPFASMF